MFEHRARIGDLSLLSPIKFTKSYILGYEKTTLDAVFLHCALLNELLKCNQT